MNAKRRSGFTLAEMLVVVTIIGILAALLVPAVYLGLVRAKEARTVVEIGNMASALKEYNVLYGEYPPSDGALAEAHLKRIFPRLRTDYTLLGDSTLEFVDLNLDPATSLVFWLKGFGPDPTDPLKDEDKRKALFDFDQARLVDNDGDATPGNDDTPVYYPKDGNTPYLYFHSNGGTYANSSGNVYKFDANAKAPSGENWDGYGTPYRSSSSTTTPAEFVNESSFQIISAGEDGDYGANSTAKDFPDDKNNNYNDQDKDNITNFSEGTLGSHLE